MLTLTLNDKQIANLKEIANYIHGNFGLQHLVKHDNHCLFELDLNTMDISNLGSFADIKTGKIYPSRKVDCLYLFKLNDKNAHKAFEKIITTLLSNIKHE